MTPGRKEQICRLLKGIETGDAESVSVVDEEKYIQHNPQTYEGSEGLAELFSRLSETNPKVNIVRVFEDEDFVFAHTEYDFETRNVGFEIFRFEGVDYYPIYFPLLALSQWAREVRPLLNARREGELAESRAT